MIKQRILTLSLMALLIPTLTCADTFSFMGTRWPSGLKKTLQGNASTLFAANGDVLAACDKGSMDWVDQINLNAPEGIIAIDYMEAGPQAFIIAACGTGGLQVIPFDGAAFSSKDNMVVVTRSDTVRANESAPADLDIKGCFHFRSHGEHLIATIDDNYGFRVFHFNTNQTPSAIVEVARQELSEEADTMLVDQARWKKSSGNDGILTIANNGEVGLHRMEKDPLGPWSIVGLGKAAITLPFLPSTVLQNLSSFTVRVSGDQAHVVENSQGNYFSFALSDSAPYVRQTYPLDITGGMAFGYPLDLIADSQHMYVTTLMAKADNAPGVQVMDLLSGRVTGTYAQGGAGALHKENASDTLFLMGLENGLSVIDLTDKTNPTRIGDPLTTPFAVHELLARESYLFVVDGLTSPQGGVRVFDISKASQPKLIHVAPTPGKACDIAVDTDFYRLFVADGDQGVRCYSMNGAFLTSDYDMSAPPPSPEAPLYLETLPPDQFGGESVVKVSVSSKKINGTHTDFLHALTDGGTLVSFPLPMYDGAPLSAPRIDTGKMVVFGDLPGTPKNMAPFLKDYILVATGDQGLQIVDLFSDTERQETLSPAIESSYVGDLTNTVSVSTDGSRYAYIADDTAGIVAFDLFSDENTPAMIKLRRAGSIRPETGHCLDLFVTDNNNCYVITGQKPSNLQIFDISDPSTIRHLGSATTVGSSNAVVAATTGGFPTDTSSIRAAYVADGQGGLAIHQTTDDDNTPVQTWQDDSVSCFVNATH